jgi:hypothetical protein
VVPRSGAPPTPLLRLLYPSDVDRQGEASLDVLPGGRA